MSAKQARNGFGAGGQVVLLLEPEWILRKNRYHMLGIEPYIIGAMRNHDRGIILDLGIGLGFWGFITKTYAAMEWNGNPVLIGVDLEESVLQMHKGMRIYAELVRGDINRLPFKDGSFDTVIAIESLFAQSSKDTLMAVEKLAKTEGTVILSGFLEESRIDQLYESGYEIFRVRLWGLMMENIRNGKRMYIDRGLKRFSPLIWLLARFLHPGMPDYVIAIRRSKDDRTA